MYGGAPAGGSNANANAMGGMMGGGAPDDLQVRRADSERME